MTPQRLSEKEMMMSSDRKMAYGVSRRWCRAVVVLCCSLAGCTEPDGRMAREPLAAGSEGDPGKADGPGTMDWPVLSEGDSNRAVVTAQYLLRHHSMPLPLNGSFDGRTEDAVVDFQESRSLVPDGVVGPTTWESLIVLVGRGDEGNPVRAVQDQLSNQHGFEIEISGEFDEATEDAVVAFQKERCLEDDGVVGPVTWNTLVSDADRCFAIPTGSTGAARLLELHDSGRITLWDQDFARGRNGADAWSNIEDAALGRSSLCTPGAPCSSVRLSGRMLDAMVTLADEYGYSYFVTSISGAFHSPGSFHYAGRAFDVDEVNGTLVRGDSSMARAFMASCRTLGAVEVFGPSNDPVGHSSHIHCAF